MSGKCPMCMKADLKEIPRIPQNDCSIFNCPICGHYAVSGRGVVKFDSLKLEEKAILRHFIRKNFDKKQEIVQLYPDTIKSILKNETIPSFQEQIDCLILWLGDTLKHFGNITTIDPDLLVAFIGAITPESVAYIKQYINMEFIESGTFSIIDSLPYYEEATLTFKGWQRY